MYIGFKPEVEVHQSKLNIEFLTLVTRIGKEMSELSAFGSLLHTKYF